MEDRLNQPCSCGNGKYIETSIHSDLEGTLNCSACGLQVNRYYSVNEALEDALNIALAYTEHAYERRQITNEIRALKTREDATPQI